MVLKRGGHLSRMSSIWRKRSGEGQFCTMVQFSTPFILVTPVTPVALVTPVTLVTGILPLLKSGE